MATILATQDHLGIAPPRVAAVTPRNPGNLIELQACRLLNVGFLTSLTTSGRAPYGQLWSFNGRSPPVLGSELAVLATDPISRQEHLNCR